MIVDFEMTDCRQKLSKSYHLSKIGDFVKLHKNVGIARFTVWLTGFLSSRIIRVGRFNIEIRKFGEPRKFDFEPKEEKLNRQWLLNLDLYKEFKAEFGREPKQHDCYKGFKLGCWKINQNQKRAKSNIVTLFDMKIKNIETDGEMSAFATAGHNGVLVCDVDQFADVSAKGILPCDVIVGIDDREINSLSDLDGISKNEFLSSKITVWRAPSRIVLN